jgi:hypothetical protein
MKPLILTSVLLLNCCFCFGQIDFLNRVTLKHEKIDLKDQSYWVESKPNDWVLVSKLEFIGISGSELPEKPNCFVWIQGGNRILSIEGSGQVYKLDIFKKHFERLDQTYFRGFNFGSLKFVRKDTLYSYGGLGFWHINNVETFYNATKKEWELVKHSTDSPERILSSLSGYDSRRDVISAFEAPNVYEKDNEKKVRYFEFDFTQNLWELKGVVNLEMIKKLGVDKLNADFIHGYYIFRNGHKVVVGDPLANQLYSFDGPISDFFDVSYEIVEKGNKIYSLKYNSRINSKQPLKIDSINLESFRAQLIPEGKFYVSESYFTGERVTLGVIIFTLILVVILLILSKKKINKLPDRKVLIGLPISTVEFLKGCLLMPVGHEFNSSDFTELMGYTNYSFETQRQMRSKLIISINEYFKLNYNMDTVIIRYSAKDDKRFSLYKISDDHYLTIKEMLNNL